MNKVTKRIIADDRDIFKGFYEVTTTKGFLMKKKDFENLKVGDTVHIKNYRSFGTGNPNRKIVYIDYETKQVVVKVSIACAKWNPNGPDICYEKDKLRVVHMDNIERPKE